MARSMAGSAASRSCMLPTVISTAIKSPSVLVTYLALAPLDLLAGIISFGTTLGRSLHGLRVQDRRCRLCCPMLPRPPQHTQFVIHRLEQATGQPAAERSVHGGPGGEVLGQHSPGAAGAEHVDAGIQHLPSGILLWSSRAPWGIKQVFHLFPFRLRQSTGVPHHISTVSVRRRVSVLLADWLRCHGFPFPCDRWGRHRLAPLPLEMEARCQQVLPDCGRGKGDSSLPPECCHRIFQGEQRVLPNQSNQGVHLLGRELLRTPALLWLSR